MFLQLYPSRDSFYPVTGYRSIPMNFHRDVYNMGDLFHSELIPHFRYNTEPFLDFESSVMKVDKSQSLKLTDDTFEVKLDVSKFTPAEISVKVQDNSLIIEGKHEEKDGKDKYISRNFIRRFQIPDGVKLDTMKSTYTAEGQLQIEAAREIVKPPPPVETNIPITFVGKENSGKDQGSQMETESNSN